MIRLMSQVFLISLSSFAYEVLLTRIFSISQWNHLSFMVISIALLGFAASGTSLCLLGGVRKGWEQPATGQCFMSVVLLCYGVSAVMAMLLLNHLPLDYFRLPLEPVQALYLLIAYLALSVPFFLAGLMVSVCFAAFPQKSGWIYLSSMTGSSLGAVLPVLLLPFLSEGRLVILMAAIPLLAVPVSTACHGSRFRRHCCAVSAIALVSAGIWLVVNGAPAFTTISPSPYKALSQVLRYPDTHILRTSTDIRGRVDLVRSPYLRFAPGLSLQYRGQVQGNLAVFVDGDNPRYLNPVDAATASDFARYTLSYAGYMTGEAIGDVLLIAQGSGGLAPLCAMLSGAENIFMLESHPRVAEELGRHYPFAVSYIHPRSYLSSSQKRFSIIHLESWGVSVPGADALTQNLMFTVEAFEQYLNCLDDTGVVIASRKLLLPPSDMLRLFASAFEALKALEVSEPEKHIVIFRNFDTFTMIVRKNPFVDVGPVTEFAREMNFDPVFYHGLSPLEVNRFNQFERPFHHIEITSLLNALKNGNQQTFYDAYPLDIAPQNDFRPYPGRLLKFSGIHRLYEMTGSRFYSLMLSGEIVVMVVFVEALAVSLLLLGLPVWVLSRSRETDAFRMPVVLYFFSLGSGFMFVEMYGIKTATIVFGDPVISFTLTVAALLVFSGFGGGLTQKLALRHLTGCVFCLIFILAAAYPLENHWMRVLLRQNELFRQLLFFLPIIPVGILMGIPFSMGMRHIATAPLQRAMAWSANGCASVISAVLAAQIAFSAGISFLMIIAAGAYVAGFLAYLFRIENGAHRSSEAGPC